MKQIDLIPIERIVANPYQPRIEFNEEALFDLAQSIRENGLIQPITVREAEHNRYEIVAGERRYRAMQMIGMIEVPAFVLDASERQMAELALVENLQRENLSAIEEAKAYLQIMKVSGCTQSQLALKMGRSQSSIANKIRLLNLDDEIQNAVSSKTITERHARALIGTDQKEQHEILDKIVKKGMTVAQTEKLISERHKPEKKAKVKGFTRDIRVAVNTVKQAFSMIVKTGIVAQLEEIDGDDDFQMIIRFPKN